MIPGIIDLKHSLNLLTLMNRGTTNEDVVSPMTLRLSSAEAFDSCARRSEGNATLPTDIAKPRPRAQILGAQVLENSAELVHARLAKNLPLPANRTMR